MERKEAIEVIKKNWPDSSFTMLREALETLISELKESEDERIRKQIISFLKEFERDHYRNLDFSSWIVWLEKQGEPTDINPSEFDLRLNKLLKQFETLPKEELASSLSFYLNVVQNDRTYKPNEKQGEQKPAELSQSVVTETSDQVWSEEDEQHIDSLLKRLDGLCRNEFERTRFAISEDEDWLKSLRQRIGG